MKKIELMGIVVGRRRIIPMFTTGRELYKTSVCLSLPRLP